ncbi:XrtA system polysaccharide chain length determinant [Stakelama tenebrarum]|uniref:Chain-length determining protein n=1 Tax=Stakelama tenebrarum TaxID=2711215 RepID=A0A6G6Y704_9SPHN|nr:XrtA system polysaccharide chain length determinant [Sphingosinithalassobacter tenebrarum]QIG80689.1 chain-length determining protein [Sphingosinithalassobacter tenebrarum]
MGNLYDEIRAALYGVWRRRWIALAVAWAVCLAGWFVVSQIPNSYESSARIFVQLRQILPSQQANQVQQQRDVDRVRQTLTSAVNLEKVVRGTALSQTVSSEQDIADRIASLQGSIKIVAQQDNLFQISATSGDPKIAQAVVQKLIDIFVEDNLSNERDEASQRLNFLDEQLAQRQRQLQEAEAKRAEFQSQYLAALPGTGSLSERISAARTQLSQVESDLAAAQSSLNAVNAQMASTPATVAGGGGAAVGPARARVAAIEGQLAEARARGWTDNHPDVKALLSQLSAARAAARNEPRSAGGGVSNPLYMSLRSMQADRSAQVAALTQRKQQLENDLARLEAKLSDAPGVAAEQAEIDRNYNVLKQQYDQLLAQREQVSLEVDAQNQAGAVKFRVIDPPTAPRTPTSPNRPMLLAGVLVMGLGAGVGIAFALSKLQTTYLDARKLERASGMPVIGAIGEYVTQAQRAMRRRRLILFAGGTLALGVAFVGLVGVEFIQRGMAA